MSIGLWSAILVFGLALIGTGRAREDRFWLATGTAVLGAAGIIALQQGVAWQRLISGPNGALMMVGTFVLAAFFAAESLGLPRAVAVRLGFGLRSRAWEFDLRLSHYRRLFLEACRSATEQPHERGRHLAAAKAHLRRIRELRPADAAWGAFRDELADLDQRWTHNQFEALASEPTGPTDYGPFLERWEGLRAAYRAEAAAIRATSSGAWQNSTWRLVLATGLGLWALGALRVIDGPPLVLSNPADWAGIIVLAGAVVFLMSIFVPSLRQRLS